MTITLIHGNALGLISDKVIELKTVFSPDQIREFNGRNEDICSVITDISTPQLFSDKQLIILENFEDKFNFNLLPQSESIKIIFRFNKELTPKNFLLEEIKKINGQVILFSEKDEKRVFRFLDLLVEKDKKVFFELEKLYEEFGGQYILTMIFFQLRKFLIPGSNLPSFVLQKLDKQKNFFTEEKIRFIYRYNLETDFKIKTGDTDDKLALTLLVNKIISL